MNHLILLSLLLISTTQLFSQATVYHSTQKESLFEVTPQYLIADRVSLRKDSTSKSALVKTLPIATAVYALDRSQDMDTINGLASYWYYVGAGKDSGWVWGGFIAQETNGSNEDPSVKFLVGFSGIDTLRSEYGNYATMHMQIRVVRGNKQLDKVLIPLHARYIEAQYLGKKGINGIHDIIVVHQPCFSESCGCAVGEHYVFWDGTKLVKAYSAIGSADADYSEWDDVVFPTEMQGEAGYVKITSNFPAEVDSLGNIIVPDEEEYGNSDLGDIVPRASVTTYYIWDGLKLAADPRKPKHVRQIYIGNGNKIVPKPGTEVDEEDY